MYIDEEQELKPHIDNVLTALERLNENMTNRIHSNNWKQSHLLSLNILRKKIIDLELDLVLLIKDCSY